VLDLLSGDVPGISPTERDYVLTLAKALQSIITSETTVDAAQLKTMTDQLNGALLGIAAELDATGSTERAQQFVTVVRNIVSATRTIVYDGAAIGAIIATIPIVQTMIES